MSPMTGAACGDVADDRRRLREGPQQFHHLRGRLLALRGEARAGLDGNVVTPRGQVVYPGLRLVRHHHLLVDLYGLGLRVLAQYADNPGLVVDVGDHVHQALPGVADGAGHVVDKMEG